jgi:3-carboxy-cis,cis-muconate cycloisomerase
MRANLDRDQGLVMAEAWMIRLAQVLGREQAHDVVYAAVAESRRLGQPLERTLPAVLDARAERQPAAGLASAADDYLGLATQTCDAAVTAWRAR